MAERKERRRWQRNVDSDPGLGVIHGSKTALDVSSCTSQSDYRFYVGVHNHSDGGILIDSSHSIEVGNVLYLSWFNFSNSSWHTEPYRVARHDEKKKNKYHIGIEADPASQIAAEIGVTSTKLGPTLAEVEFLLETKLLLSIPRHAIWSLLNCMQPLEKKANEKIVSQGEPGNSLFLIQKGECVVEVEKDDEKLTIARLSRGDVVGEMAVLTGEPRSANVKATTDMKLWTMGKDEFETVSLSYPELRMFLTELVSSRLESSPHTSDRTIGKYLVKHKLGHGAWGIIYQGVHSSLNKTVAVKMLKHTMAMDEDFHSRFKAEAKIIAMLNHRNIVHVYDIEELYKTLFIIMEYLEGESLEDILARQGRILYPRTANFLSQVCAGLAYAHEQGIVHQDIKPANLQVLPDDTIKILDFGLACDIGSENFDMEGTAFYMAPEQIESEPVDERTDIYCLGVTAYEMVTGRRPYPENDLAALLDMHVEQDIPDPKILAPDLPDELHRFIIKACEREPARRYQNMYEAMDDLLPYYRKHVGDDPEKQEAKQLMTSLFFFYRDEQVGLLNDLLEEVSSRAEEIGVTMRASEFRDL